MKTEMTASNTAEQRFATSFLYGLSLKKTRYNSDYEPSVKSLGLALPIASRPFPLDFDHDEETSSDSITLKFKVLKTTTTFELTVSSMDMIENIKSKVSSELKIPMGELRLVCAGKGLSDGKTIMDYNLSSSQTIHVMRKPSTTGNSNEIKDISSTKKKQEDEHDLNQKELSSVSLDTSFWKDLNNVFQKHFEQVENMNLVKSAVYECFMNNLKKNEDKELLKKIQIKGKSPSPF